MRCLVITIMSIPMISLAGWEKLLVAQSLDELLTAETQVRQQKKQDSGCHFELKQSLFPEYCMQRLASKLLRPAGSGETAALLQKIDQLCIKNHQKIMSLEKIDGLLSAPLLSKICRQHLQERRLDLIYIENRRVGPNVEVLPIDGTNSSEKSHI